MSLRGVVIVVVVELAVAVVVPTLSFAATLRAVPGATWLAGMTSDGSVMLVDGPTAWHRISTTAESVAVGFAGDAPNASSDGGVISSNGRYVAFISSASNLVPDDPNGVVADIFIRDLTAHTTERLPVSDASCRGVSDDGRFVLFVSSRSDLVPGDTNGCLDAFMFDRQTSAVERVSVGHLGQQITSCDVPFLYQQASRDGRYVLFTSTDTGLVPEGGNGNRQAFMRDRLAETTTLVSLNSLGQMANDWVGPASMSFDGRYVAFTTTASNFLPGASAIKQAYLGDLIAGTTECVSLTSDGDPGDGDSSWVALDDDGRYVAFVTRSNNFTIDDEGGSDVYLKDRVTGVFTQVSRTTTGQRLSVQSDHEGCLVSADGRFVAIQSYALGGRQVFLWDRDGLHDVPASFWAFDAIAGCFDAGIVSGFADGAYMPSLAVDRAQMAVYVSRALAGGDNNVPAFTATPTFPDVPADNWALRYIEYAADQGVVTGYDDGSYHPIEGVNRAQMAVYVARALVAPSGETGLADYTPSAPRDFPDVTAEFWAYKHIEYCVEHGVVQGYDDGKYHPEYAVARDQTAVYIARAFGLL